MIDKAGTDCSGLFSCDRGPDSNVKRSEVELSYVQDHFTAPVREFSDKYLLRLWTLKDRESFQRKLHPRFTIRFMPSYFPNSITGEKRPRVVREDQSSSYSYGAYDGSEQKERQQLEIVMREHNL